MLSDGVQTVAGLYALTFPTVCLAWHIRQAKLLVFLTCWFWKFGTTTLTFPKSNKSMTTPSGYLKRAALKALYAYEFRHDSL